MVVVVQQQKNNKVLVDQPKNDHHQETRKNNKKNGQEETNNEDEHDEQKLHNMTKNNNNDNDEDDDDDDNNNNNNNNNDDDDYDYDEQQEEEEEEGLRSSGGRGTTALFCFKHLTTKKKFPFPPIIFDLLLGVVIPLFSIILFSVLFGYILAKFEEPIEISINNEKIAFQHALGVSAIVQRIITKEVPKTCLQLYLDNYTNNDDTEFLESYVNYVYDDVLFKVNEMESVNDINITNIDNFFLEYDEDLDHSNNNEPTTATTNATIKPLHPNNNSSTAAGGLTSSSFGGGCDSGNDYLDVDSMTKFMEECGSKFDEVMESTSVITIIGDKTTNRLDELGDGITINWIKCNPTSSSDLEYNGTGNNHAHAFWKAFGETFVVENPSQTEIAVLEKWKQSQFKLLEAKLNMYKDYPNMTSQERRERALNESLVEANGFEGCIPDTMAAAWFWFTVMTTIGYGNATPQTDGGRALVYVFGFISIMYFAAVLGKAGDIVTRIVDDTVRKHPRRKFIAKDYVGVVMWGGLYYIWLLIVATCTVSWKSLRTDTEMSFQDAYWFSFISTTTVGLGDYYLEPSAIGFGAIMVFATLFLVGFVLLANFILNLTNLLKRTVFGSKNIDEYLHEGGSDQ